MKKELQAPLKLEMDSSNLYGVTCPLGKYGLICYTVTSKRSDPVYESHKNKETEPRHDKTNKMSVRPAMTQISLGIRPVWSESSLCAQWVAKGPGFLHADSEEVFAGRTLIVGFVMLWLNY